jgi:hypothetical protein
MITLGASWFYFAIDHEQVWLRPDQEPPEQRRHTIEDREMMAMIAWKSRVLS